MSDFEGPEMAAAAEAETCPECHEVVELSTTRGRRGMLKSHFDKHGIVCGGSWGLSVESDAAHFQAVFGDFLS